MHSSNVTINLMALATIDSSWQRAEVERSARRVVRRSWWQSSGSQQESRRRSNYKQESYATEAATNATKATENSKDKSNGGSSSSSSSKTRLWYEINNTSWGETRDNNVRKLMEMQALARWTVVRLWWRGSEKPVKADKTCASRCHAILGSALLRLCASIRLCSHSYLFSSWRCGIVVALFNCELLAWTLCSGLRDKQYGSCWSFKDIMNKWKYFWGFPL